MQELQRSHNKATKHPECVAFYLQTLKNNQGTADNQKIVQGSGYNMHLSLRSLEINPRNQGYISRLTLYQEDLLQHEAFQQ